MSIIIHLKKFNEKCQTVKKPWRRNGNKEKCHDVRIKGVIVFKVFKVLFIFSYLGASCMVLGEENIGRWWS